jgi:hypothetical protein
VKHTVCPIWNLCVFNMELSNSNTWITFLLCAMHQRISAQPVEYSSEIAQPAQKSCALRRSETRRITATIAN